MGKEADEKDITAISFMICVYLHLDELVIAHTYPGTGNSPASSALSWTGSTPDRLPAACRKFLRCAMSSSPQMAYSRTRQTHTSLDQNTSALKRHAIQTKQFLQ